MASGGLGAHATLDDLRELIARLPRYNGRPVTAAARFEDLGLDSLDRLELLVAIEDRWGIALPDEHLHSPTVADVASALRDQHVVG
jgi:acyl carrier protein